MNEFSAKVVDNQQPSGIMMNWLVQTHASCYFLCPEYQTHVAKKAKCIQIEPFNKNI